MKRLAVLLAIVICAVAASAASATISTQTGSPPVSSQMALNWNSYAVDAVRSAADAGRRSRGRGATCALPARRA